jgi:hypothetical protein
VTRASWKEKLQYRFDNLMAGGVLSLIGLLFIIGIVVIVIAGLVLIITELAGGADFPGAVWDSLMHLIDQGTITGDDADQGYLALMLLVTLAGLMLMSLLIGVVNQGLSAKMDALGRGRSRVLESGHTLILGFNESAFTILAELCETYRDHGGGVVVLLAEQDSHEVVEAIHARIPHTHGTRIIVRSGRPDAFPDLRLCSVEAARSVIVNLDSDPATVKTILAVHTALDQAENSETYITAVLRERGSFHAARAAGGERAQLLYLGSTLGRITAHACRQPGISAVFAEVLSYGGDEIYVERIEGLAGRRMDELNLLFGKSMVLGLVREGRSLLNPPADTVVEAEDRLILLAADYGVSRPAAQLHEADSEMFAETSDKAPAPQNMLVLGANAMLPDVLTEEDEYLAPGSQITVAAAAEVLAQVPELQQLELRNMALRTVACDVQNQQVIAELLAEHPQNVLVLTDPDDDDATADANVLLILLLLHDLAAAGKGHFTVTSETRSVESQELASVMQVTDFVVSSRLTALMMTQISQTRELGAILEDLLSHTGSELYTKPASRYVKLGPEMDFYTVSAAVAKRGEVFIGLRHDEGTAPPRVRINPLKSDRLSFTESDSFIVVAQS